MFSDIPEAFVVPGEFVTRGQNFHEEAMRLWRIEERKGLAPSVVGLQSFMILASEYVPVFFFCCCCSGGPLVW